ncbi:DUF5675 family protein [Flavihumibacter rivuli]|uniref:DUF5675 family protein n=1 Tax=Flavihumibacter rivuli TaxID=2838156 RepID=UPI001BDF093A|nr:DUF5675 family protein [Flavihumibacter rivuli]ULQ55440.1 DUF5675 family protein [Flavihumibacter rivuli]
MELLLQRSYQAQGTNGRILYMGKHLVYTIELPWRHNIRMHSCIPEGRYRLQFRYSERHKLHLMVTGVPDRTLILIHKANDAERELRGCIAPVTRLTGQGKGEASARAFARLMRLVFNVPTHEEPIWLVVEKLPADCSL